jgi:hypothetical protein
MSIPITPAELLVLPNEDREAFNELRAALHAQYSAATPTELFLVEELVQTGWRIRRFRIFEAGTFDPVDGDMHGHIPTLAIVQRCLASAERAYHRSLAALTKLQQVRRSAGQRPAALPEVSPKLAALAEELDRDLPGPADFERLRAIKEKVYAERAKASAHASSATVLHSSASGYTSQSRVNRAASVLQPGRSSNRPPEA